MSSGTSEIINKPGRWTKAQEQYMKDNINSMSIEDMSRQLEKNPITVRKYCIEKLGFSDDEKIAIAAKFDIKKSPIWDEMKLQLSDQELDAFMYHWQNLMVQFKHDALATERQQMVEVVRLEILINRVMRKLKDTDVMLKDTRDEIVREKESGQPDQGKIARLEMLISGLYTAHQTLAKEYQDLLQRKQSILKEIRGTREQRIKRIEDSKETIQTWMSSILDNPEYRKSLGIEMKKQQLALYRELERLSDYHTYEDGQVEQPLLNSDTIKDDNR
jgi:hypothetical protein